MPREIDFGFSLSSVIVLLTRVFDFFYRPALVALRELVAIAWPPPTAAIQLAGLPATVEAIFAGRQRSRAVAYETRRLQRDPLDLNAGCGLRLAA